MPFSIIAVLLLVLTSASVALYAGLDDQRERSRMPQEQLESLKGSMDRTVQDVARMASSAALDAVKGMDSLDAVAIQEQFSSRLNSSLARDYPDTSGDNRIEVNHQLMLQVLMASLSSASSSGEAGTVDPSALSSIPSYFTIVGNYSINVSCPQGSLTRTVEVDQEVLVPLPLMLYKINSLRGDASPRGAIESMVRYELTALVQDRVLRGWGTTAKTGSEGTREILTPEDVMRAVNLALALDELRYFQSMGAVDEEVRQSAPLAVGLEGPVDPADLFLRSYSMGDIDLASLVGQSLYARADAIILKWLDYLGLVDIADLGEDIIEFGEDSFLGMLDRLTGGDHDQDSVVRYLSTTMAEAGIQEYDYRWFCYGGGDIVVNLPPYRMVFNDDNGNPVAKTFRGTYVLDLPSLDLLSSPGWGEVNDRYRSETHRLAEAMREYIRSVAEGVATHCSLPLVSLELDPCDGESYLDEITRQLDQAFASGSSWLSPALQRANEIQGVRDGLAQALLDHLDSDWMDIFDVNRSVLAGAQQLTGMLMKDFEGMPNFSSSRMEVVRNLTLMAMMGDHWGAREEIYGKVHERASPMIAKLSTGLSHKTAPLDPMVPLLSVGISSIPGLEILASRAMKDTIEGCRGGLEVQGGPETITFGTGGSKLILADGRQRLERFTMSEGQADSLAVNITLPWELDRASTMYPNRHITDVANVTATPYITQWTIEYEGEVDLVVVGGAGAIEVPIGLTIPLHSEFNLVALSGWGLEGVEYEPTATLNSDLRTLVLKAYDFIVSAARALGDLAGCMFVHLGQFVESVALGSATPMDQMGQMLSSSTTSLGGLARGGLGDVLGALADGTQTILDGTSVSIAVLGVTLTIVVAPRDTVLAGTVDSLRIDISQQRLGTMQNSSLRLLRLPTGEHTVVAYLALGGDDWSVDITLDPLQMVFPHQVEVKGLVGGWEFDMYAPEVQRVQKVTFSLGDIPLMQQAIKTIPSPVPGTKFNIDAGMEFSFNIVDRRLPLINEVELNPQGTDRSREWVEIYNPTNSTVDLSGWSLSTFRGTVHHEGLNGVILPYGRLVHRFTGQALDNGDVEGFPLQESVALIDPQGERVDSVPWLKDLHDDGRTWQRSYDGAPRWELRNGTRGTTNGLALSDEIDPLAISALLAQCFEEAFNEVSFHGDMESLREIIVKALHKLRTSLLDSIEASVASLRLFIKLGISDLIGTAGGGFAVSLVYDGRAVRDCMEWFGKAILEVLRDPFNPLAAGARAEVPLTALADHVFVQTTVYMRVAAPDLIEGMVKAEVQAQAMVRCSLGTLGIVSEGSKKEVQFGLSVSGLQGARVKTPMGQSVGATTEIWLLRGSLRPS